jgi:UDP-N-acetylmuramyl pentapeptide phosphotransferase/UDP-N-acetylglucosamine-1-phosphate transferase
MTPQGVLRRKIKAGSPVAEILPRLPPGAVLVMQISAGRIGFLQDFPFIARAATAFAALLFAVLLGGPTALGAALMAAAFAAVGMPLFRRYAMARPNARSSHVTPVPQGGGAAVVIATLAAAAFAAGAAGFDGAGRLPWIAAAALLLAVVGAADDIRGMPVLPRLGLQVLAVGLVVWSGVGAPRILPEPVPPAMEYVILVVAGAWFVNLTNFMDGIDGITLAGFLPLAAGAAILAGTGRMTPEGGLLAICFFGGLAGFVFFNLPRASLFLGDVGSLPIGLVGGALLLDLAQNGAFAAAVILPLYHFTDATLTLLKRLLRREKVWEAHRQHAYQNAADGGWTHAGVSGSVLALNAGLAALAVFSAGKSFGLQAACVCAAALAVGLVIAIFRRRAPVP